MSTAGIFLHIPLGMNFRNYLVAELNPSASIALAKDKARFKCLLDKNGILVPRTYFHIREYPDLSLIGSFPGEFVIKPNQGHGGNGILVLKREGESFVTTSGEIYSRERIARHIRKILDGEFSGTAEGDSALVEERIYPSSRLLFNDLTGLPNIRVFCYRSNLVMAMLQYPTQESRGRANLSQGAVGIGIEMESGRITHIHTKKGRKSYMPEDIGIPPGFIIPGWEEIKSVAAKVSGLSGLGLAGVDTVLDSMNRVVVLEINGRPGLEIQNINEESLLKRITSISLFLRQTGLPCLQRAG